MSEENIEDYVRTAVSEAYETIKKKRGEQFQDIDKTLAFIRDHAPKLAKAKAERIYLDNYKKPLFAILYGQAPGKTIPDRENWAYASEQYQKHLRALQIAIEQEETIKWQMTSAQLRCEVWRSEQANARFIDRSHQ